MRGFILRIICVILKQVVFFYNDCDHAWRQMAETSQLCPCISRRHDFASYFMLFYRIILFVVVSADARWWSLPWLLSQLSESRLLSWTAAKKRRLRRVRKGERWLHGNLGWWMFKKGSGGRLYISNGHFQKCSNSITFHFQGVVQAQGSRHTPLPAFNLPSKTYYLYR